MQRSGLSAVFTSLKTHKYAVAAGLLLASLPLGYAASDGSKAHSFVAAALADPLAVLKGRSPGERTTGKLAQSKRPKGAPNTALKPSERVLANVRTRPTAPAAPDGGTQAPLAAFPGLLDAPAAPQGVVAETTPTAAVASIGGVGGGLPVIPGVLAGGGGSPGSTGNTAEIPTAVVPVPEPEAWFMMITGFLLMGMSLRSRQRPAEGGLKQNT